MTSAHQKPMGQPVWVLVEGFAAMRRTFFFRSGLVTFRLPLMTFTPLQFGSPVRWLPDIQKVRSGSDGSQCNDMNNKLHQIEQL